MKAIKLYQITRHYTKATVLFGSRRTQAVIGTVVIKPDRALPRRKRYHEIAVALHKMGFCAPVYRELRRP